MMEQDHRGATRRTSQDHLERVQPRWNDDADRIGEREVAARIRIEGDYPISTNPRWRFDQREDRVPDLHHFPPSTHRAAWGQPTQAFHAIALPQIELGP